MNQQNDVVLARLKSGLHPSLHQYHQCFSHQTEEGRARFKYFPGVTSNDLLFYIEPTLGEDQLDTAIIQVGIKVLLQNILKIAARCKMHGMNKIFVLNTGKVSSYLVTKLNLDIVNICKSNSFHFIVNNNISINFLYKDVLHLLYSGKELLAKNFYFTINNFLRKHTYHPNIHVTWKQLV